MSKNRYYYYDHEQCAFVELKPQRKQRLAKVGSVLGVALVLAGIMAWSMDGLVGTPQELALQAENEALQDQLSLVERRMEQFSQQLDQLSTTDQTLYRTLLEAEPISEDVRQVGVGGSDAYEKFNRFSRRSASLLRESAQHLDALERQINLQNTSYRELSRLARERGTWLAAMPAILPTDGPIVSGYGMRRHPILRVRKMHAGLDMAVSVGTPVFSTGDGVIKEAAVSPTYGKYVKVEHPTTGYTTLYAHLSEIPKDIKPGKEVKRGEQIALSGNTGRSTGPHLHYEVRDAEGRTLNPVYFFAPSMTPQQYRKLLKEAEEASVSLD